MHEVINRNDLRLRPVFERLRRRTIYSEKDFQSPLQILQRSNLLTRYRDDDPDAFIRETTTLFSNFSRTGDASDINASDLIATLFALRDNPDKIKYRFSDTLKLIEIEALIDSLLGKNLDFVSGKKESSIILPSYLILRSLKENNSLWTWSFMSHRNIHQQTIELRNALLESIHTKKTRAALEKKFQRGLGIDKKKEEPHLVEAKSKRRLLVMPRGFKPLSLEALYNFPFPDFFSDSSLNKLRSNVKDNEELSNQRIFINLVLDHGAISIDENGQMIFHLKPLRTILEGIKNDEDLGKLYVDLQSTIGLKKMPSFISSASVISMFSDDQRPDTGSWIFKKNKDPNHPLKLTQSFDQTLLGLFKRIKSNEDIGLSTVIESSGEFNFSQFNRQLTLELYRNYSSKPDPTEEELRNFARLPGIDLAIKSLRKLTLMRIMQKTIKKTGYHTESIFIPGDIDLDQQKLMDLTEGKINIIDFREVTQLEIIKGLAYYSVEKYLEDNKKDLNKRKHLRAQVNETQNKGKLLLPDDLDTEKINIFNSTEIPFPIITTFNIDNSILEVYLYDIYLGFISVDIEKSTW